MTDVTGTADTSSYIIGKVGLLESLKGYEKTPRFQSLIPGYKEHEDREWVCWRGLTFSRRGVQPGPLREGKWARCTRGYRGDGG